MASVDVLISVNFEAIDCQSEFLENLRSVGLENINSLESIGIITGSVEEDKITDILTVEGVTRVERSQDSQIPPPDSPIQ
jgi:hypothetical protein